MKISAATYIYIQNMRLSKVGKSLLVADCIGALCVD